MEEARSLGIRRVEREFAPDRMADAILSKAFEQLTRDAESIQTESNSVQNRRDRDGFKVPSVQEVMR
jgi:hypothetical protein